MDRFFLDDLDRAYELSYFIHQDKELALQITIDAISKVEVQAVTQDKRRYYQPVGRWFSGLSGRRSHRNRVSLTKAQLLQRLLLITSEPHERRQEAAAEDLGQDSLTVRYIAYLVRLGLKRNAFYVALGLGRLLHTYTTRETMALYDLVLQAPERYRGTDYFRTGKKVLFEKVLERFGSLLETCRGRNGERCFAMREPGDRLAELIRRSLSLLTPWDTGCTVPERFHSFEDEIQALRFRGSHPDDEHVIEVNRIHALVHPDCLRRLTRALGIASPEQRLAVPLFCLDEGSGGGGRGCGGPPPQLDDADRRAVVDELQRREDLRRRVAAGVFRVLVDGVEVALWHVEQDRHLHLVLTGDAELVEVVGREPAEDVLLAAHLLPPPISGGPPESRAPDPEVRELRLPMARVHLKGGGRLDFMVSAKPVAAGSAAAFLVEIRYRETQASRVGLRFGRWLVESLRMPVSRQIWRSVTPWVLLILAIGGAGLWLEWPKGSRDLPRIRGAGVSAVTLAEVDRIFVDPLGQNPQAHNLRASLEEILAVHDHLTLVTERGKADAVMVSEAADVESGERIILQLVNARGEVLWRGVFRGSVEQVAAASIDELDTVIRRAGGR